MKPATEFFIYLLSVLKPVFSGIAKPMSETAFSGVNTAAKNWFLTEPQTESGTLIFSKIFACDAPIPKNPELSVNALDLAKCALPLYSKNARFEPYTSLAVGGTAPKQT